MHDPIALAAELRQTKQQLRETEDQLAQARRQIAWMAPRLEALQVHEAIQRIPPQPPDGDSWCGEYPYGRPVRDAGSIDTWQETT